MKNIATLLVVTVLAGNTAFGADSFYARTAAAQNDAYYKVDHVSVQEVQPNAAERASLLMDAGILPMPLPTPNTGTAPSTGNGSGTAPTNPSTPANPANPTNPTKPAPTPIPIPTPTPSPAKPGSGAFWDAILGGDWNTIVLVGRQIVDIIKANEPVVNIKSDVVSAVPVGVNDWQMLAGWQPPMTKFYSIKVVNKLGMTPVDLRVKISAMWGGNAGGKGKYLSNVLIVPSQTYVGWGYNLDLWSDNSTPVNSGTSDAPVAALTFSIRYKVKNYFQEIGGSKDYYLTGEGKLDELPQ